MNNNIVVVVATRVDKNSFFSKTATGRTLVPYLKDGLKLCLFENNRLGLPRVYNRALEDTTDTDTDTIFVFLHDDIYLTDFFWPNRVVTALGHFDLVGLAGNKRRVARQPSWAFINDSFVWDEISNLSGVVGHGNVPADANISYFGVVRQRVALLDGLFLAAHKRFFVDNNIRFDEQFNFHFYDLDICRQAEERGLRCGTWDISVVHQSGGSFGSRDWIGEKDKYFDKWRE